jgi:signal transduction histidine kinase
MVRSLRSRLIISHLLPLLIVVPLASLALIYTLETQLVLTELSETLTERANLIIAALEDRPDVWNNPDLAEDFVLDFGNQFEGQLILLTTQGSLIAASATDSNGQQGQIPALLGLETALGGESSVIISYSIFSPGAEVMLPVIDARQELLGIVGVTQTLEGIFSQIGQLRTLILIILLVELLLGSLIGFLLARNLERPIGRAAAGVINIAEGKDIEPIPVDGPKEIRQLSASVNILEERLRLLEETRQRSLANIVNELGRPLGAIQSAIHVLLKGTVEPQVEHELLLGVDGEIKRMQPLLDDLALLHGQVTGTLTLEQCQVSLSDWLPPALLPWRAAAIEKGINWEADIPADLPAVLMDPERIAQVLGNLLSNAVKYTPKGGSINVTAGTDSSNVWFQVNDTGLGIDPVEHDQVFEPFYRSQREHRFPQGLGLGLTIAREIVTAHGGLLELTSTPGQGSQFTVYLPLDASHIP